jgi:glycosyltransferase involved in cell wall biosynthesis
MEFFRGGEAVLEQFGILFPDAPIYMLVYNEAYLPASLQAHPLYSSFIQRLPVIRRHFRKLLPLFPEIIRAQRLPRDARFVLSSDASLIKGVRIPVGAAHVCYCHSPPRYLWGLEDSYLESSSHGNRLGRMIFSASLPHLRSFDQKMAQRVDRFIANSRCVQDRIRRCYDRDSVVINPPVEIDRFDATRPREDFYLVVSALVPYKRVDLAVDACSKLNRRLVVIGTGPEEADLRRRAAPCVTFLGWQSKEPVRKHFERCRAFLFPGIEDFGITPCEAQAAGAPVIAFGEGGALETVREGVSGFFFREQTVAAMADAIQRLEAGPPLCPEDCRANIGHLGPARFRREIRDYLRSEFPDLFSAFEWPGGIF